MPPLVGVAVNVTLVPAQIGDETSSTIETLTADELFTVTAKLVVPSDPHELLPVTVMFPFCPPVPDVTVIELVPAPAVTPHPVGTVQE